MPSLFVPDRGVILVQSKPAYGGQAVLEGVMIRGPRHIATAVRLPDGDIAVRCRPFVSLTTRSRVLGWPLLRGPVHLWESLSVGMRELFYSLELVGGEDEKLTPLQAGATMATSFLLAIGLFFLLPTVLVNWASGYVGTGVGVNLLEGVVRLSILILYIALVSRMEDVRGLLAYHGAEHRVINGFEDGADMSVDGVRSYSAIHNRCGTSFLFLVAVVSVAVFALFGWPGLLQRLLLRLLAIPLIAALAYEVVRLAARGWWPAVVLALPGTVLQKLTTREPDDHRVEVALAALGGVRQQERLEVRELEGQV